jgi:hypothetical protein
LNIETVNLKEEQQRILFHIVRYNNKGGRTPKSKELCKNVSNLKEAAARGKIYRLAKRRFILYRKGRGVINAAKFVTWPETAKSVLILNSNRMKKDDYIDKVVKDKNIKITDGKVFEKEVLTRLIRDGYIQKVQGMPGFISLGPTAADLSIYLKLLAKDGKRK